MTFSSLGMEVNLDELPAPSNFNKNASDAAQPGSYVRGPGDTFISRPPSHRAWC